jgi:ATP-dependent protease ClpP protease subunit
MAKTSYQLHLKGFVGGYDFDSDYVDYILNKNKEDEVNVLIDSFGGQVSTALSISSAFKRHGNVHAHFVGMNASAATIASLGAKKITMDKSAMYLVHKCSTGFFQWGSMNADDLQSLINNVEKQKADLDKLDANIAEMYATKCKKNAKDLLELMKKGGWLTANEAKEWGFVDELTDYEGDETPVLTDNMVNALASAGIPIPTLPNPDEHNTGSDSMNMTKFMKMMASFFHPQAHPQETPTPKQNIMKKVFNRICTILDCKDLESQDGKITLSDSQMDSIEAAVEARHKEIQDLTTMNKKLENEVKELKGKPADETHDVVTTPKSNPEQSPMDEFVKTSQNAHELYDLLP